MSDRIDLLVDLVREQSDKIDKIDEKLDDHRVDMEHRVTKVEADIRLRTRVGAAVAAGLPALSALAYFVVRFLWQ